jgi:hypothetical protein
MPLAGGGYGFSTEIKPNGAGTVVLTISACLDLAAPPQQNCG